MFGSVNSSVEEDHAVINWEYSGPDRNVYVEYVVDNSKIVLLKIKNFQYCHSFI